MRAFPMIQPIEYNPDKMAKGIEKHRLEAAGLLDGPPEPPKKPKKETRAKKATPKPVKEEPKKDGLPLKLQVATPPLSGPSQFAPRQDPMGIDFEKIAMRRA